MMAPLISLQFPVLFSGWVISSEPYWSTLAKRPSLSRVDHAIGAGLVKPLESASPAKPGSSEARYAAREVG
jgi:hypothetical protein